MTRSPAPSTAYELLASTNNKISRAASRVFNQQFGLGVVEWRILGLLGAQGVPASSDICRLLDVDKGAVSRSVASLEERGWVSRDVDAKDGRRRLLALTPSGAALQQRLAEVTDRVAKDVFAGVSQAEEAALVALLQRLSANAAELIDREAFRKHSSRGKSLAK